MAQMVQKAVKLDALNVINLIQNSSYCSETKISGSYHTDATKYLGS